MRQVPLRLSVAFLACAAGLLQPAVASAKTRRLRFDRLTVESGLAHSWVRAILKDHRGYVWFGTADGLNRFDGVRFVLYRRDPRDPQSPATTSVGALFEDSHKRLWVGGAAGLQRYERGTDRLISVPADSGAQPSPIANVRQIAEDRAGQLWLATERGLFRLDPEKGTFVTFAHQPRNPNSLSDDAAMAVVVDAQGRLWVGTRAGLDRLDVDSGRIVHVLPRASDPPAARRLDVEKLHVGGDGTLWLATMGQGLLHFDPQTGGLEQWLSDPARPLGLNGNRILGVLGDGQGSLFLGLENRGLDVLDLQKGTFTHHLPDPEDATSLSGATITALLLDDQGTLWAGTFNGGVNYSSPYGQRFGLLGARRDGLSDPHVAAVIEDRRGDLWIGSDGGGLFHLARKTGRFTHYAEDPMRAGGLGSNAVLTLTEDNAGQIWVGTWGGGLYRVDPGTGRFESFLRGINIRAVRQDSRGPLLIGTEDRGALVLDRATGQTTPLSALFAGAAATGNVSVIAEDRHGSLWLGGRFGTQHVNRESGSVTAYTRANEGPRGLGTGDCQAILVDSRGSVWIGTGGGGLSILKDLNVVRRYGVQDGLPSGDIRAILEDGGGNLWISTARGLARLEAAVELPEKPKLMVFDVYDGLQGSEFNQGAAFRCRSGEMLFGGQRGLSFFLPREIEPNPNVPPVVLTGLRVFNRPQAIGAQDSLLKQQLSEMKELTVSYRAAMLTFEFAALNYVLPQKNRHQYKLEGFDQDWVDAGTQHSATYTSLPTGRSYVLRVRGSNNDGAWNNEGVALKLNVTPPLWLTWWAKTAAVLLGAGLLFSGYRLRVHAIHERRHELELQVEERTAALSRANEAAQREQELLHALMDNIPDLIYFKDREGRFTRINQAHAAALGLGSAEEAVGKTDADFFPAEFARETLVDESRLMETGEPMVGKIEHDLGKGRWLLATKVPMRAADGRVTGLVGISKDITGRRQAEEQLQRELEAFLRFASTVAEGDLTRRAAVGRETLGQIAGAVNKILESLAEILTDVRDAAFSVSSASSEILAASTEITKGAQFGRDQVHATSTAVEEMAASLGQVAKNAEESAQAAQQALEHLSLSDRAVQNAGEGMLRIDRAVSETAEKARLLGERSGEIFAIIDLIEEIASRSELLSMNAAIEAAHAGDAGRGFGVVADEIRHLAERSTEATRSVTTIVKAMAAEIQSMLVAMETSTREVKQGLELSEQARRGLGEISAIVRHATDLAGEISAATREQTSASQTVATAMGAIANITEQSTASASETTRAVRDLVALSEHLTKAIARFRIDSPEVHVAQSGMPPETVTVLADLAQQLGRVATQLEAAHRQREAAAEPPAASDGLESLTTSVTAIVERLSKTLR